MAKDFSISSKVLDTDKYVYREERDLAKTQVDWGTISKNLTDTINTVRDERETQKAEIEKANTEAMNRAGEFDQYNNKTLNESVLEGSEWAKNALSVQMDQVRRGLITPAENQRYQQRVSDSFTFLKKNLSSFEADFNENNRRAEENESNTYEQAVNGSVAGLGVLKNWKLSGNAATGELAYVRTGNDPATGKPYDPNNPANQTSLGTIGVRATNRSDYTSTTEMAQAEVGALAEVINSTLLDNQAVRTIEDWRDLDESEKMMTGLVKTLTSTRAKIASIAQDKLGFTPETYNQSWSDEELAEDPDKVRLIPDPSGSGDLIPDYSPEQIARVEEAARLSLESQIDQKIKTVKGFADQQSTSTTIGKKDRDTKASSMYGEVVNLVTGDAASAETAATALASIVNANLKEGQSAIAEDGISRSDDSSSWSITLEDGSTFTVDALAGDENKTPKSMEEIVKEIFQEVNPYSNINVVMAAEAFTGEVPNIVGEGGATGNVKVKPIAALDYQLPITVDGIEVGAEAYLTSKLDERFDAGDNAKAGDIKAAFTTVVNELIRGNSQLTNLGFEIGATDADDGTGVIQIRFPGLPDTGDGEGIRVISDTNDKSVSEAYSELQNFLDEWVDVTNTSGGGMSKFN